MSKTIFRLSSIRCMNGLGTTNQPFRECQAGTVEGRHQVLREYRHTHRKYSTQQFAYPKSKANKTVCQSANTVK